MRRIAGLDTERDEIDPRRHDRIGGVAAGADGRFDAEPSDNRLAEMVRQDRAGLLVVTDQVQDAFPGDLVPVHFLDMLMEQVVDSSVAERQGKDVEHVVPFRNDVGDPPPFLQVVRVGDGGQQHLGTPSAVERVVGGVLERIIRCDGTGDEVVQVGHRPDRHNLAGQIRHEIAHGHVRPARLVRFESVDGQVAQDAADGPGRAGERQSFPEPDSVRFDRPVLLPTERGHGVFRHVDLFFIDIELERDGGIVVLVDPIVRYVPIEHERRINVRIGRLAGDEEGVAFDQVSAREGNFDPEPADRNDIGDITRLHFGGNPEIGSGRGGRVGRDSRLGMNRPGHFGREGRVIRQNQPGPRIADGEPVFRDVVFVDRCFAPRGTNIVAERGGDSESGCRGRAADHDFD